MSLPEGLDSGQEGGGGGCLRVMCGRVSEGLGIGGMEERRGRRMRRSVKAKERNERGLGNRRKKKKGMEDKEEEKEIEKNRQIERGRWGDKEGEREMEIYKSIKRMR